MTCVCVRPASRVVRLGNIDVEARKHELQHEDSRRRNISVCEDTCKIIVEFIRYLSEVGCSDLAGLRTIESTAKTLREERIDQ